MESLPSQRHLFSIPDDVAYLNAAYMGPFPNASVEAGERAVRRKSEPWTIFPPDFFEPVHEIRSLVAGIIGLDAAGVAVVPSASYGLATVAANVDHGGRDVVLLAEQFPSNVYVWRELAARTGASVRTVARPDGDEWTSAVIDTIDDGVGVVAVPPSHWADGTAVDLKAVASAAREVGAAVVIDGTQAIGAWDLDLAAVAPDAVLGGFYKWLLGPYSLGYLWVAPELRDGTPLEHNWVNRAGSEDFAGLVDYKDTFQPGAQRYDMGEVSNFHLAPIAIESLRQITSWGVPAIEARCQKLTDRVVAGAEQLGFQVPRADRRSPNIVGLRFPDGVDVEGVAAPLRENQVWASVRGTALRVAPHVYNTDADVDLLLSVLADTIPT